MSTEGLPRGFSNAEWLSVVLFAIGLVSLVLFGSYRLNQTTQHRLYTESTTSTTNDVGMYVAELRTILTSLLGVHYASGGPDGADMATFSSSFLEQSPFITRLGKFDHVADGQREDFEQTMSEQGLYNFRITELDAAGKTVTRSRGTAYSAITRAEPYNPTGGSVLGFDLNSSLHFTEVLKKAIRDNEPFITDVPNDWPFTADVMVIRPAYFGMHPPSDEQSRVEQYEGGYWLTVDLEQLLSHASDLAKNYTMSLTHIDQFGSRVLLSKPATHHEPVFLRSLHAKISTSRSWQLGSSTIVLGIVDHPGFSLRSLLLALAALLISLGTFGLTLMSYYKRRVAEYDHNKNLRSIYDERERAEKTLNSIADSVYTLNSDLMIVHMNPSAEKMLGVQLSSAGTQPLHELLQFDHPGDDSIAFDLPIALRELSLDSIENLELVIATGDPNTKTIKLTYSRTLNNNNEPNGYILVLRDVSQEVKLTRELKYQANHDALTKCKNRYYFEYRLGQLIDDLSISDRQHALCYLDLDQFKIVNDTCGHSAGDALLIELTNNLNSTIRKADVLARIGGDEFGLILTDVTSTEAEVIANRVYQLFQNYTFTFENKAFAVRASIGFVLINRDSGNFSDVMAAADIACYTAKDSGRNSIHFYSLKNQSMSEKHQEMNWLPELRKALDEDSFRLLTQPIAKIEQDISSYTVDHYEFLLRLVGADGELTTPYLFIKAAERYDLMREIDRWVIRRAFQTVQALQRDGTQFGTFSINLSGQSIADSALLPYIRAQFDEFRIPPSAIWFEITETAAISHFALAVEQVKAIRAIGCKVALDDFGSGLSSFGYLKNFPVDILKIDGQFVREIDTNTVDLEMVRAFVRVSDALGIETIAEFVETESILNKLAEIGIDYAQGYLIGKPCPIEEALENFTQNRAA